MRLTNISFLTDDKGNLFVRIHHSHNGSDHHVDFVHGVGHQLAAEMLRDALNQQRWETIEGIRKAEYDAGWKDAKSKKRKRDWFNVTLKREATA